MAKPKQGEPKEYLDFLGEMSGGVNDYAAPLLLQKNVMSTAANTTVRNDYVSQRPCFQKIFLDSASQKILNDAISLGPYQGGCYFKPDPGSGFNNGAEGIATMIGSVLASIFPDPNFPNATVKSIPITYNSTPNSPSIKQVWMWQSECFVIIQDGLDNPLFYNVTDMTVQMKSGTPPATVSTINPQSATQSLFATTLTQFGLVGATPFTAPAIGATVSNANLSTTANASVGTNISFLNLGNMTVAAIIDGSHADLVNVSVRPGTVMKTNFGFSYTYVNNQQLPPGRMGDYGLGRNWFSLIDGRQFVASDIVGGSSGTPSTDGSGGTPIATNLNYRNAVLNITENLYLAGGGNFIVPGAIGSIQAMRFMSTLDTSLGQGPLQVFTHTNAFSCQTPVERVSWQDVNNPILTESLKGFGATGQYSTINVNSDILMRSIVGIQSFVQARRDFDVWGNVPISVEISSIIDKDNQTLLNFGSAIVFDNRFLMTGAPFQTAQGVLHKNLFALNLDPISSLRGKQPSVYDTEFWSGLNVFQLFVGSFANRERAFALTYNNITGDVELYEILESADVAFQDDLGLNNFRRIVWTFSTASLFKDTQREFKKLWNGEIYVDELEGQCDFAVYYSPDQSPCWYPWIAFSECQTQPPPGTISPGYRHRLGLGNPIVKAYDPDNDNRPTNTGYTFRLLFVITGKCRFVGAKFLAVSEDEPEFQPPRFVQECGLTPP